MLRGSIVVALLYLSVSGFAANDEEGTTLSPASLQLLKAAYEGSASGVLQALQKGAELEATVSYKYLVGLGYESLTASNIANDTAIVLAVKERHVGIVKILLEHGADPNSESGDTMNDGLLEIAVFWSNVEIAKLLLQHGADPNKKSGKYLLLGSAVRKGSMAMVKLLVKHGANINTPNGFGSTALHVSAVDGGLEGVPNFLDFIFGKYTKIMRFLLDNGADPHVRNNLGETPLLESAELGFQKGVELLLQHGAKVDTADNDGNTPLLAAAGNDGGLGVIKLLLKANADIDAVNEDGNTALHAAADFEEGSPKTIKLLLANGADPNAVNKKGQTPLDLAQAELEDAEYTLSRPDIAAFYNDPKGRAKRHAQAVKILKSAAARQLVNDALVDGLR